MAKLQYRERKGKNSTVTSKSTTRRKGYTKAERDWIKAHGGTIGVVSEAEAQRREREYKRREAAASALGEIPPRRAKVPPEAYDIELPGDRPTPTKPMPTDIVLPGDIPTPTKKGLILPGDIRMRTKAEFAAKKYGKIILPGDVGLEVAGAVVTLQGGERVSKAAFDRLSPEDQQNLQVLGVAGFNRKSRISMELAAKRVVAERRALQTLSRFKEGDMWNLAKAIEGGVSAKTMKVAGFDVSGYNEAKRQLSTESKLKPYADKDGNYDIVKALRRHAVTPEELAALGYSKDTVKWAAHNSKLGKAQEWWERATPWDEWKGEKATAKDVGKLTTDIAIAATPVVGTVKLWHQMSPTWKVISIVTDVLCIVPVVGGIAAGARVARGLGAGARAAAIAKATGRVALAELKAPYTMIRHPVRTAKVALSPWETILRPKKLPTAGMEIRATTVRLPVGDVGSARVAMKARDQLVGQIAAGAKPVAEVEGQTFELSRAAINRIGTPAIVHSTPDIRPFLEGGVIGAGREGSGLFVSPTLHTNFTMATAFGDMPGGGIRGGLIVTDSKVLKQLASSEKLYRGQAEIEGILRTGTKLPPPSQILITRDMAGEKLTLLVMGKPLTAAQVAKLKFIGSLDTIKQMFISPAKIGRVSKEYDKLVTVRQQIVALQKEAKALSKQGKAARASAVMARANDRIAEANRIGERIAQSYRTPAVSRVAAGRYVFLNTGRTGVLERYEGMTRRANVPTRMRDRIRRTPDLRIAPRPPRRIERRAARPGIVEVRRGRRVDEARRLGVPPYVYKPQYPTYKGKLYKPVGIVPTVPYVPVLPRAPKVPVLPRKVAPVRKPRRKGFSIEELSEKERQGIVAWKQGWCYKAWVPSWGTDDMINSRKPLEGVKYFDGPGSAAASILAKRGKIPPVLLRDMGIMDVRVEVPQEFTYWKRKPKIHFKADPKQRTTVGRRTRRRTVRRKLQPGISGLRGV